MIDNIIHNVEDMVDENIPKVHRGWMRKAIKRYSDTKETTILAASAPPYKLLVDPPSHPKPVEPSSLEVKVTDRNDSLILTEGPKLAKKKPKRAIKPMQSAKLSSFSPNLPGMAAEDYVQLQADYAMQKQKLQNYLVVALHSKRKTMQRRPRKRYGGGGGEMEVVPEEATEVQGTDAECSSDHRNKLSKTLGHPSDEAAVPKVEGQGTERPYSVATLQPSVELKRVKNDFSVTSEIAYYCREFRSKSESREDEENAGECVIQCT